MQPVPFCFKVRVDIDDDPLPPAGAELLEDGRNVPACSQDDHTGAKPDDKKVKNPDHAVPPYLRMEQLVAANVKPRCLWQKRVIKTAIFKIL